MGGASVVGISAVVMVSSGGVVISVAGDAE